MSTSFIQPRFFSLKWRCGNFSVPSRLCDPDIRDPLCLRCSTRERATPFQSTFSASRCVDFPRKSWAPLIFSMLLHFWLALSRCQSSFLKPGRDLVLFRSVRRVFVLFNFIVRYLCHTADSVKSLSSVPFVIFLCTISCPYLLSFWPLSEFFSIIIRTGINLTVKWHLSHVTCHSYLQRLQSRIPSDMIVLIPDLS